jgi:NADH:ubiquinone oxidoreductase subunit F (NADH-binding)
MGGAGQLATEKWEGVRTARGDEKYIVCNADESEPGTFKDRELLSMTPYLVIEGVIVAGLTLGATKGYIYVRHEYHEQIDALNQEIAWATTAGLCGDNILGSGRSFPVEVYISPGGYVCGEQSALIEAMEDKRSEPRNKPPELLTNGLWDMPTLVNNVETLAWVPYIAIHGGAAYRDRGVNGCRGMRFFSLSGDVERPGVFEVPIGITLGQLIDRAGGMLGGKPLKAAATSGPSGGFMPATVPIPKNLRLPKGFPSDRIPAGAPSRNLLDLELDIDVFRAFDLMLGAGIVVYAEGTDIADQALNCTRFFRNESCGKCVPCRQGSQRLAELGAEIVGGTADSARISEIADTVNALQSALRETSICGLGMVAAEPLATAYRFFRDDINRHVTEQDGKPGSAN